MSIRTLFLKQRELVSAAGYTEPWVLIFDIDSTIMNTQPRNQAILDAAFAAHPDIFTGEHPVLDEEVWDVCSVLLQQGMVQAEKVPQLRKYWKDRFFTNEWLSYDRPYPHVAECLNLLEKDGFSLVYLTGRDSPGMEKGTRKSFTAAGIPTGDNTNFIFKPEFSIPDTEFKETACNRIARLGTVTGIADNMSDNSNLFAQHFPHACHICLNTVTPPDSQRLSSTILSLDIDAWVTH